MSVKDLIKGARRPERSVLICLRADLTAEMQDLERDLQRAEALRLVNGALNSGTDSLALAERMEVLRQLMIDHTIEFRLRAVSRNRWTELVAKHPPRPDNEADKQMGINGSTFFDTMLPECTVEPVLDEDDWHTLLNESLSDAQYTSLINAVWGINCRDVDVPFSAVASRILQTLETDLKLLSD